MTFQVIRSSPKCRYSEFSQSPVPVIKFVKPKYISFNKKATEFISPAEAFTVFFDPGVNLVAFKKSELGSGNSFKITSTQYQTKMYMTKELLGIVGEERFGKLYTLSQISLQELGDVFVIDLDEEVKSE
jgi:hypothetical protein